MGEKGANTFPFYNLPPKLKKIIKRSFLFFSPFPIWIKEKSVATLVIRNICDKTQKQVSSPIVLQNWRLCWVHFHSTVGLPLDLDHF